MSKKNNKLDYGEGQREEYGEGESYKPEDKTKAADEMGKNEGFGAGVTHTRKVPPAVPTRMASDAAPGGTLPT